MTATLGEIIKQTYFLMNEPEDSTTYDRNTYVLPKINAVIQQICK
jgi:hypothetical protein